MTLFLDLDGPVLDTAARHFCVFRTIIERFDCSTSLQPGEYWALKRTGKSSADLLEKHVVPKLDVNSFMNNWLREIESPESLKLDSLQPNAYETIGWLAKRFWLVMITLRQSRLRLEEQLQNLALNQFFRSILCADPRIDSGWRSKSQLISQHAFEKDAVIVGDTEIDVRAGKALDIATVAVSCGIRTAESLKKEEPDALIENLVAIKDLNINALREKPRRPTR